jgi:hypothetical protein
MDGASAPFNTQITAFKAADLANIATDSCHGNIHIDANSVLSAGSRCTDERFGNVILICRCADCEMRRELALIGRKTKKELLKMNLVEAFYLVKESSFQNKGARDTSSFGSKSKTTVGKCPQKVGSFDLLKFQDPSTRRNSNQPQLLRIRILHIQSLLLIRSVSTDIYSI